MRVLITRPSGEQAACLVAYIPAHVELDQSQLSRYHKRNAPPRAAEAIRYGRFVFLFEGTADGYYICPDSRVGKKWWRKYEDSVSTTGRGELVRSRRKV